MRSCYMKVLCKLGCLRMKVVIIFSSWDSNLPISASWPEKPLGQKWMINCLLHHFFFSFFHSGHVFLAWCLLGEPRF